VADPVLEVAPVRSVARAWRKDFRSGPLPDVLLVLFDEPTPENAEIRLSKSDCSVLRVVLAEEAVPVDELFEVAPNWEISCSIPLTIPEYCDVAVVEEEVAAPLEVDVEADDELPFELDSDSRADIRSCTNFLKACRTSRVESVGFADAVEPAELRLEATSLRKVVKSGLLPDVPFVLLDEFLPESADIRLLKSVCSVLSVVFVEEELPELLEPACSSEISCSSPLEKLE